MLCANESCLLAEMGVANDHKAALMLVTLPDRNASCEGGWMFEYVFEQALSKQPVLGKIWRFKSAHNVEQPCAADEKKMRVKQEIMQPFS